jgi:hypothetical protein
LAFQLSQYAHNHVSVGMRPLKSSLSSGSLTPESVDPNPQFSWNTLATKTNIVSGNTELQPSTSKAFKLGGAFVGGADVSFDLQKCQ